MAVMDSQSNTAYLTRVMDGSLEWMDGSLEERKDEQILKVCSDGQTVSGGLPLKVRHQKNEGKCCQVKV